MILRYEQLEMDVHTLQRDGKMGPVSFCEKYKCEELRFLIYANVIVHGLKINIQKLYSYLKSKQNSPISVQ